MASSSAAARHAAIAPADLQSFSEYLRGCSRILALLGAGLSASSGLPTFRGAGGLWRSHEATELATPEAFAADPGLVWQFYSHRRHLALKASPNRAHYALAALAKKKQGFITLSQNVDGLSQRAGHPSGQLHLLHGSLFDVKCTSFYCNYVRENDFTDPIVPALAIPTNVPEPMPATTDKTGQEAAEALYAAMDLQAEQVEQAQHAQHTQAEQVQARQTGQTSPDISDARIPMANVDPADLPSCPECKEGLLRPGVVWFGEALPSHTLDAVDEWIKAEPKIDLMLVIGTSAKVWPAAGYVDIARSRGARVAVINMDPGDIPRGGLTARDWLFQGDAGAVVPELLKSVIGDI